MHFISDLGDLLEQGKVIGMYTCRLGSVFLCVGGIFFFFILSSFFGFFAKGSGIVHSFLNTWYVK